ncbi:MAG: bactofilin family protein [Hyphomicrobiaceae bacterium]
MTKPSSAPGPSSNSIIDEWLTMRGDLESEGDILVKGRIRGNVTCKLLIIDEKASVEGGVVAEEAVVRGATTGTIRANRVRLEGTARVDSEIFHRSFSVEEGARIEGALHYQNDPLSEASQKTCDQQAKTVTKKEPAKVPARPDEQAASSANGSASAS